MRALTFLLLGALALGDVAPAQDDFYAVDLQAAERYLLRGKLARARALCEEILDADAEEPEADRPDPATVRRARQVLMTIGLRHGEYAEVARAIEALPESERSDRGYRMLLARSLARRGRYDRAIELLRARVEADPRDLEARYRLGAALQATGRREQARAAWQGAVELQRERGFQDPVQLAYLGRCVIELGGRENLERASYHLVDAIRAAPERPEARIAFGELNFLAYSEASGFPSGERHFKKVLEQNGDVEEALIGIYRLRRANFQLDPAKTEQYLRRALALNPRSVPALIERGSLLLDDRRFEEGARVLDEALAVNPRHKWALAHRTAAALLRNDVAAAKELRERALAVDSGFDELDRVIGDHLVALYRFADAIPYYRKCLRGSPESVPALHGLAKALIYTGRGDDAVELLEKARAIHDGLVQPWRNNALAVQELLDEEYVVVEGGSFRFRMHRDDAAVLREYFVPMHREARRVLGERYGYEPDEPVNVEVLHTWADFSVRTIGFRGFSALGACFGGLITLVSPSDGDLRKLDFMWSATVWHEYAHVLTLALSEHRVPRWLTEGFSVYEEKVRNPAWERGMQRELVDAYHNREIPPVRLLNRLFRGPRILFGYYQGGLIVDYLAREHGFAKVLELLEGYARDRSTEELFRSAFGIGTEEFDRRFLADIERRFIDELEIVPRFSERSIRRLLARIAAAPDDLDARVDLGWAWAQRDNPVDAGVQLRAVLAADPEHGRGLLLHAELLRRRGDIDAALAAYAKGFAAGAEDFDSRIRCGRLLAARGDVDGAVQQYQLAKRCWPGCTEQENAPNLLLYRLLREQGRKNDALMELKAYCQRTARAFEPRLELARLEKTAGNRKSEARYLREAVEIDPFMRSLHVRLGEALVALGRLDDAAREYRVALAVPPELDREYLGPSRQAPDADAPEEREARAAICVELAKVLRAAGRQEEARGYLERAGREAAGGEAAAEARRLRELWDK